MTKSKSNIETVNELNSRNDSIKKLFALDIVIFNIAGLRSVTNVLTGKLYRPSLWEFVFFVTGITPMLILAVCVYLAIVQCWAEDRDYAISLFTILFDSTLCLIKGITMWSQRMELSEILRSFKISWNESLNREIIRKEIVKWAIRTNFFCKCFAIGIFMCCIAYAGQIYFLAVYYYLNAKQRNASFDFTQTIYPIKYPHPHDTMMTYVICIFMEQSAMFCCGLYWTCSDTMFAKLCTYATIQFRVLCYDLEHTTIEESEEDVDCALIKRLSALAKRHHDLYVCCKRIERIYNPIIFLTMLFTSANMCICVFQMDKELSRSSYSQLFTHLTHIFIIISQVSIYCGYAERLTHQSSLVAKSAYDCQWMDRNREFKIILLIVLLRAQKTFCLTAYGFVSLNLSQITAIVNTAASYFALLKTIA